MGLIETATAPPATAPTATSVTLTQTNRLSATVIQLIARRPADLSYQPGQYAMVHIDRTQRALSFAAPATSRKIEFFVDISPGGVASRFALAAKRGETVNLTGPYGSFIIDADSHPLLFIAGSTGIAPIKAQILAELERDDPRPMTLLFGHRRADDIFLDTYFKNMAAAHPLSYYPACEQPAAGWTGTKGRITDVLPTLTGIADYSVYICGSPGLIAAATNTLYEQGADLAHVHTEMFT